MANIGCMGKVLAALGTYLPLALSCNRCSRHIISHYFTLNNAPVFLGLDSVPDILAGKRATVQLSLQSHSILVLTASRKLNMALRLTGQQFRELMGSNGDQHELLGGRSAPVSS